MKQVKNYNHTGREVINKHNSYNDAMNALIHPPQNQYRRKVEYQDDDVETALKESLLVQEEEIKRKSESEQTEKDKKEIAQLKEEVVELQRLNEFLVETHKKEIEEKDLEVLKKNEEIKLMQAEIKLMQDELKQLKSGRGEQDRHYTKQKTQAYHNHEQIKNGAASARKERLTKYEERKNSKLISEYDRKRQQKHQGLNQMNEVQMLQMALDNEEEKHGSFDNLRNFDHNFYQCGLSENELLRQAIEESKRSQPNPDNMSYEQLLALGDQIGKVSKGLSKSEIAKIPSSFWNQNYSTSKECAICYEEFTSSSRIKSLPQCNHDYHQACIDKWLMDERRCPVCNMGVSVSKTQK